MRESHSLGPNDTGFTDRPAYFNGLITHIKDLAWSASLRGVPGSYNNVFPQPHSYSWKVDAAKHLLNRGVGF